MDAKKQTAVEWLMEQITYDNGYGQRWISFKEATDLNIYFEDAKAMEKEQMGDAYYDGKNNGMDICNPLSRAKGISFEEYYKGTYVI